MNQINTYSIKNPKWKAIIAVLGARRHYAEPIILAEANRLECFYTDLYFSNSGLIGLLRKSLLKSRINIFRRGAMRFDVRLPSEKVKSFPMMGIIYTIILRLSLSERRRNKIYARFGKWFNKRVVFSGIRNAQLIIGVNGASLEMFEAAQKIKMVRILDQCIAPYIIQKKLLKEEMELWPNWESNVIKDNYSNLIEREIREWEIANTIFCGSQFVVDGLTQCGVAIKKCQIIPSAIDINLYSSPINSPKTNVNDRLKILFLGSVNLRKGIQYLYNAIGMIKNLPIEVQAAGQISISPPIVNLIKNRIKLFGLIPRFEIIKLLEWADVLVLPSICEGSAMVTYEALASGIPVITTPNAGSPVQDGITGFIVPIRNPEAIAERLEILYKNPQLRLEMGQQAQKYAKEHLSWEAYSKRFLAACEMAVNGYDELAN